MDSTATQKRRFYMCYPSTYKHTHRSCTLCNNRRITCMSEHKQAHNVFVLLHIHTGMCVCTLHTRAHTQTHTHTQTCACCWMVVNLATAPAAMGSVAAMATASPSLTQYKNKWRTQHSLSVCLLLSRVSYLLYSCLLWFQFSNHTCNL